MKAFTYIFWFSLLGIFYSCDDIEDPIPVNEEEVITTIRLVLTPEDGGAPVLLESRDLDGLGPGEPVLTVSSNLSYPMNYDGQIEILNETVNPADQITEEVEEEGVDHQFFFNLSPNLATINYADQDENGDPIGLAIKLSTTATGTANFSIILRHEPDKSAIGVADGEITNAGGESDLEIVFEIAVD